MGVLRKPLFISHWPEIEPKIILEPTWWLGAGLYALTYQSVLPTGQPPIRRVVISQLHIWYRMREGKSSCGRREFSDNNTQFTLEAGGGNQELPLGWSWPHVDCCPINHPFCSPYLNTHTMTNCSLVCIPWSVRMLLATSNRQSWLWLS